MSVRLYVFVSFAFAFLYTPIVALVVYSFNASPRVTVWQGFSTRWYGALLEDTQILDGALLSLKVALMNATFSVILGTLAAFALVRYPRFRGRTAFTGLVAAPLVMPEVITGLSLLLLFVASQSLIGWPANRGITTITIPARAAGMIPASGAASGRSRSPTSRSRWRSWPSWSRHGCRPSIARWKKPRSTSAHGRGRSTWSSRCR